MTFARLGLVLLAILTTASLTSAQTYSPTVTMAISLPDGTTQDVSTRDSTVGTIKAKDGTAYEVRPTIHDEPFTTVTVAIFKAATATDAGSLITEVQVKKGAAAVDTKSKPAFKVAVKNIEAPKPVK